MLKKQLLYPILILGVCLMGCNRKRPQYPANKAVVDTTAVSLIEMNKLLVSSADKELAEYVAKLPEKYTWDEAGFWYRMIVHSNLPKIRADQEVTIHTRMSPLKSETFCEDAIQTVTLGKKQLPTALELMLTQMREGEQAHILAPWYLAYGQLGDGACIPAYSSVRINVTLLLE